MHISFLHSFGFFECTLSILFKRAIGYKILDIQFNFVLFLRLVHSISQTALYSVFVTYSLAICVLLRTKIFFDKKISVIKRNHCQYYYYYSRYFRYTENVI